MAENGGGSEQIQPPAQAIQETKIPESKVPEVVVEPPVKELPLTPEEQLQYEKVKAEMQAEQAEQLKKQLDMMMGKTEPPSGEVVKSQPNIIVRFLNWIVSLFRRQPKIA